MRLLLLLTAVTMVSLSAGQTPAPAPESGQSPPGPAADAENSKRSMPTYRCYQCHNYAGDGRAAGPRLAERPMTFRAFTRYLREPTGQMPPYVKGRLGQELANIYAFLRALPAPPSVDGVPILKPSGVHLQIVDPSSRLRLQFTVGRTPESAQERAKPVRGHASRDRLEAPLMSRKPVPERDGQREARRRAGRASSI